MKKYLLKSFALVAMLFSAMTMSAATYCSESMKSNVGWDGNYQLSAEKVSETQSRLTITALGEEVITGFYQFIIQNLGGGAATTTLFDPGAAEFSNPELFDVAADGKSAMININWTTYPTGNVGVHMILRRNNSAGGSDIFGNTLTDVDFSAACDASDEGGGETGVPVLENVELFGAAQNFVLLTPTASDDKGVTSYLIAKSGGAETEVTPDATTGQIKIASLTLGKEYTYIVKAKDADGNESNEKEITFSTLDNVFCEEEVLPGTAQEFANQKLTFTAKKVSDTETYFAISSSTSTLTKISSVRFYNNTGETGTYGGGVLPEGYVLKDGWILTDNTLSKTVTWTTYPTAPFRASINASRETNSTDEKALINVLYTMDVSNTCGEEPDPTPEPEPEPTITPGYSAGAGTNAGANYTYVYTNDDAGNVRLWVTFSEAVVGVAGPQFYTDGNVAIAATTTDNKVFFASVSGKKDGDEVQLRAYIPRAGGVTQTPLLSHIVGVSEGLIVTEYCDYTDSQLTQNGAAITLTWETADNGDVVITMGNGIGANSCAFRNGGFEGGINAFVISADNFVTTSPASDYFTYTPVYSGNEARLVKIADLPKGTKIKYNKTAAFSWTVNEAGPYIWTDFIYTYGGVCNKLDAPSNVAVTDAGVLTFDEVVGANAYEVHVYQGTTLKHTQNIVNGGTINFEVYVAGTYTVKVIAKGEGKGDSSESDPVSWNMQASPLPGSNYCETLADRVPTPHEGPCNPLFTWLTDATGNVVITVSASEGDEGATMFRGNGMNGTFSLDGSVDNFNAYFNRGKTDDYTYTLTLKDAANTPLPGSVISFSGQIEAKSSIHTNDWSDYEFDGYLYGTKCATLDAPTNVAITPAGVLTFDAVEGADTYLVHVYDGATLKLEATIASGNTVEFYAFADKTYQVCVVAKAGTAKSEESEKVDWAVTAAFLNTPSEYCEQVVTSGTNSVIFDWQTNDAGSVIITISEADGGAAGTTHFRANAMSNAALDKFKVGEGREAANLYFERVYTENAQVYELRLKAGKQLAPGTKIYHTGNVEFASESEGGSAYHNYGFEYTYGTRCVGYQVSATSADPAMGSAVVKQNGVEVTSVEGGIVQFIATPAEGCVFVNWNKDGVEVSTAATYETEITATTRLVANFDYIRTIYCQTPVLTSAGHTVYLTIGEAATAGKYQIKIEGTSDMKITGINNANTAMNCIKFTGIDIEYDQVNDAPLTIANGGWEFSEDGNGVITSIEFEPCTGRTWKDMWMWKPDLYFKTSLSNEEQINAVLAQQNHFDWSNTCEADTEKPVMGSAQLISTTHNTAIIQVSAIDNKEIAAYHIVDATNAIDKNIAATDGTITMAGLKHSTTYQFTITAIDKSANESANSATITATTNQISYCDLPTGNGGDENYADMNGRCLLTISKLTGNNLRVTVEKTAESANLDFLYVVAGGATPSPAMAGENGKTEGGEQSLSVDLNYATLTFPIAIEVKWSTVGIPGEYFVNCTDILETYLCQDLADKTAPVMGSATLATVSHNNAIINVEATDNEKVAKYRVVFGTSIVDVEPTDNQIVVDGLQESTSYTFTIYAIDAAGNISANSVQVAATTVAFVAEPSSLPTAPTWPANQVKAVYSATYNADCNFEDWGSETTYNTPDTYGKKFVTTNYGYFGLTGFILNCSKMETLHMDIWCANTITLGIVPIYKEGQGVNEDKRVTKTISGGQWNSVDIPLTDFVGVPTWDNIHQIKIDNVPNQTLWFNNIYFYTNVTPTIVDENTDLTSLTPGTCDLTLIRNFVMDGDWNTICLPFALTADQVKEVFGEETKLTKLSSSTLISSTEVDILFEEVTSMEAVTPYLIKPEKNVNEGVFLENVTINTTPNILEAGITKMIPVLKTQAFTGENNTFFLGANEVLYKASTSGNIMAMRAYFQFSTLTPEQLRNVRARVVFNENTETSVDNITIDEAPIKVIQNGQLIIIRNGVKYNVQGQKL